MRVVRCVGSGASAKAHVVEEGFGSELADAVVDRDEREEPRAVSGLREGRKELAGARS